MTKPKALLIDVTKCIGCMACYYACKEANKLPETEKVEEDLSATNYTVVKETDGVFYRKLCMHCNEPTCASVCPVKAFEKTPEGPVIYHDKKCIGCRYCIQACPFDVPAYEWKSNKPLVKKCTMCAQRQKEGKITACAEACPTGATYFGDREELLAEARKRIQENPGQYINHIYGEKEVGGTSVLIISSIPFEKFGFRADLIEKPLSDLTWEIMSKIPNYVVVSGVFLYGIYWIINRRMELSEYNKSKNRDSSEDKN
ncbi:MAG: 4Fe-4S dicluster domain-containing protein [candidate division Zixibacteria bacterium]|nr:4Fe-4S dicluster domain-containing protein [candidate division Zixibacteria bacterium]